MQQRRGTAATWTSANPILAAGEIGFETDTNKFKIGDGSNRWATLTYFSDNASLTSLIDGAPALLDTLNELAAAVGDDPAFFTTVATNLSNHEADTTSIHGIANTAELATKTFAAELLTNAIKTNITISGDKNGLTITAENGVADSTTDNLTEGTTNKYYTDVRARGAISGGTGLDYDSATGEFDIDSTVTTNSGTQTLSNKTLTSPKINEDVALTATATELNSLDGIISTTSELNILSGVTATSLEINTLDGITSTALELNVLDGITVSTSELNSLDNISGNVQTLLDAKAPLASAGLTGTPTAPTAAIGTNTSQIATTAFVDAAILDIVNRNLILDGGGV